MALSETTKDLGMQSSVSLGMSYRTSAPAAQAQSLMINLVSKYDDLARYQVLQLAD